MAIKKPEGDNTVIKKPQYGSLYTKDELISAASAAFNVKPEVVAGALYGDDKGVDGQGGFTKEYVLSKINSFMQRKV